MLMAKWRQEFYAFCRHFLCCKLILGLAYYSPRDNQAPHVIWMRFCSHALTICLHPFIHRCFRYGSKCGSRYESKRLLSYLSCIYVVSSILILLMQTASSNSKSRLFQIVSSAWNSSFKHWNKSFRRLKLSETTVDWDYLTARSDWLNRINCSDSPVLSSSTKSSIAQ